MPNGGERQKEEKFGPFSAVFSAKRHESELSTSLLQSLQLRGSCRLLYSPLVGLAHRREHGDCLLEELGVSSKDTIE